MWVLNRCKGGKGSTIAAVAFMLNNKDSMENLCRDNAIVVIIIWFECLFDCKSKI